jgi:hypothetical protein
MPPALLALVIFETGSCFMPGPQSSYSCLQNMTCACHHTQLLLVEIGSHKLLPWLTLKPNPPDFCLQVSGIINLSHHTQAIRCQAQLLWWDDFLKSNPEKTDGSLWVFGG